MENVQRNMQSVFQDTCGKRKNVQGNGRGGQDAAERKPDAPGDTEGAEEAEQGEGG